MSIDDPLEKPGPLISDYWVRACVYLRQPLVDEDDSGQVIVGYFRNFGIRAATDQIVPMIDAAVAEGQVPGDVAWNESDWYGVVRASLDEAIQARSVSLTKEGIWYMSGRMFFPAEPN